MVLNYGVNTMNGEGGRRRGHVPHCCSSSVIRGEFPLPSAALPSRHTTFVAEQKNTTRAMKTVFLVCLGYAVLAVTSAIRPQCIAHPVEAPGNPCDGKLSTQFPLDPTPIDYCCSGTDRPLGRSRLVNREYVYSCECWTEEEYCAKYLCL
ncbi:hypothetical protein RRG08_046136 [Elysia crispata]|uniref:Uncharacterized protein n=1 Tax=Elysia crispata TaxID=231223 RepID=A0AAE1DRD6_9GAST|nr:hypothetical protein RRG08_046136 [Elysia crispata]